MLREVYYQIRTLEPTQKGKMCAGPVELGGAIAPPIIFEIGVSSFSIPNISRSNHGLLYFLWINHSS